MTEIEATLNKYLEALTVSEMNLETIPAKFRSGKEGQKREARESLEGLREKYKQSLQKATYGISVSGPGTEAFIRQARDAAEVLVVDGQEFYQRLAARVQPTMGARGEFGVSQYSTVIQELRTIAGELEVASMPSPKWTEPVNVGSGEGLLKHITNMVDSSIGLQIVSLYVNRSIVTMALEAGVSKTTVPVIVTGLTPDQETQFMAAIFQPGRISIIKTPKEEEVTETYVLEVFNDIKKTLKSKKPSNSKT